MKENKFAVTVWCAGKRIRGAARWCGPCWFALALLLQGPLDAVAQNAPDDGLVKIRTAVTDPALMRAGHYFKFHDKALAQSIPARLNEQLAGNAAILKRKGADELAREYLSAYDGASSDELTVGFVRESLGRGDPRLDAALKQTTNTVQMPDGNRLALPVPNSYGLHLWLLKTTAEALQGQVVAWPQLAGRYIAEVEGPCALAPGELTLTQRDFRLEGTRDERLLLSGAVGGTEAWFITSEVRYSTTTLAQGQVRGVAIPDQPSELLRAALGSPVLRLLANGTSSCAITLRPST